MKAIVFLNDLEGIGIRGRIPWKSHIYNRFVRDNIPGNGNNAVVMGRKTFRSFNSRPLFGVRNVVMTRNPRLYENISSDVMIESNQENVWLLNFIFEHVYIIGGSEIYQLFSPYIDTIHVFQIHNSFPCDTFFPISLEKYHKKNEKKYNEIYYSMTYTEYEKVLEEV
jgi:dihydrofolate reductase